MFSKAAQDEKFYLSAGAAALYRESYANGVKGVDRVFGNLFLFEWALGIAFAITFSGMGFHVYAAVLFGGLLAVYPAYRNFSNPGDSLNRYVTAVAQMGFSALYAHVSGGRIEAHFHIFGSLAFLAFYRDVRVLVLASLVTALDHFAMGVIAPMSIYGTLTATPWRAFEHTLWVVFEDVILIASIRSGLLEMQKLAQNRYDLQATLARVERLSAEREAELLLSKETIIEQAKVLNAAHTQDEGVGLILVQDLIETALSYREEVLHASHVTCELDLAPTRVWVSGRASELTQAVVELLDRAIESTSGLEDRRVNIRVTRVHEDIRIDVESNGAAVTSLADLELATGSIHAHSGELTVSDKSSRLCFSVSLPNPLAEQPAA